MYKNLLNWLAILLVLLAILNEQSDAEYIFYKNYLKQCLDVLFPKLEEDDIVRGSEVCRSFSNSVSVEFAKNYK